MAHFDTQRVGGVWVAQDVPCAATFQRWDVTQSKAVNGDAGGSYAPSTPIVLGGAGLILGTSGVMQGGIATLTGGRLFLSLASGDAVNLSPARARTIAVPTDPRIDGSALTTQDFPVPPRYTHNGALVATVAMTLEVLQRPEGLPVGSIPRIELEAYIAAGTSSATVPNNLAASTWASGTVYPANTYIVPTDVNNNGYYVKTTAGGTSGGTEPVWPSVVGTNTTDNTVTWTTIGRNGQLPLFGQTADSLYNNGMPQAIFLDLDNTGSPSGNLIAMPTKTYVVRAFNFPLPSVPIGVGLGDLNMRVLGIDITFSNITTMAFW
jgi:hypothetical protein